MSYFPLFLMLYEFAAYMSTDMYMPAFPIISKYFGVSDSLVQTTYTSWLAGGAFAQVILGPLSDRYGRRPILLGGGIAFLLSCLFCIFAPNITSLIIARFIQGIGVCSLMIAGYATIHESYDDQKAIRIIAIMGALSITAPMIGPLLGGWMIKYTYWQSIFWVIFTFALLLITGLFFTMPESNINRVSFDFNRIYGQYKAILFNNEFMRYALIYGLMYSAITVWIGICPYILMEHFQLSPIEFGLSQIPIYGSFIFGTQILQIFMDRLSLLTIVFLGVTISTISLLYLFLSSLFCSELKTIICTMALFSLGFGLSSPPLNRLVFNASNESKGAVTAMYYTCMMTLGSALTFIMSVLYNKHIYSYAAFVLSMMIVSMILMLQKYTKKKCAS